ncbi:hypothetical protein B0T16DRAFT_404410 [Cercophora newfieldiana]|uniref:Rhodopsin domain-containing protein n=1 Tax=Cercophora newfieldiana TaxID=92897 RepID=A0AA40CU89_9PEZI|nr:hypothetical protein B0T16DRAFT_404410 [Cercophora newfieldiana]
MAWVGISGIVFVFLQLFQCVPVHFIWEGWKKGDFGSYSCLDVNALAFATATFSIAQDVVILVLPLPLLAKLDVSRRSKLGIMLMFSLGIFVFITSCVRLWTIYSFGDSVNPTWDYTNVLIWTGLEVAVSIIVTSLPAIRVLLSHSFPYTFGSPSTSRRRGERGYTSTSSFGNDTYVASWHSAPPALKRLSAISRISSIVVGRMNWDNYDVGKEESHIEMDDKLSSAHERHSCPADIPGESAAGVAGRGGHVLPSIGDVLSGGGGGMDGGGGGEGQCGPHTPRRTATTISMGSAGTTVVGRESPGSEGEVDGVRERE